MTATAHGLGPPGSAEHRSCPATSGRLGVGLPGSGEHVGAVVVAGLGLVPEELEAPVASGTS